MSSSVDEPMILNECWYCHKTAVTNKGEGAGVRFKVCGNCRSVHYCSPECQVKDWPQHRQQCIKREKTVSSSELAALSVLIDKDDPFKEQLWQISRRLKRDQSMMILVTTEDVKKGRYNRKQLSIIKSPYSDDELATAYDSRYFFSVYLKHEILMLVLVFSRKGSHEQTTTREDGKRAKDYLEETMEPLLAKDRPLFDSVMKRTIGGHCYRSKFDHKLYQLDFGIEDDE